MDHKRLGNSGLKVSRLCLGCMTYGAADQGNHSWTLSEEESRPFIRQALDLGITFFDTANVYSDGSSEEIVGRAFKDFVRREDIVLATKVNGATRRTDANATGLSRRAIMREIDASLSRLQTDYVDLYQIHRWDDDTPIEETMEALHDVVRSGKATYIGASSMSAWQFSKAQYVAKMNGWTPFISMQNQLSLLYREEEREMLPLCADQGVGLIPWSPQGRGLLTRPWGQATGRSASDNVIPKLYGDTAEMDCGIVDKVEVVAKRLGVPMSQVALAWVLHNPLVTAPIIGASKPHHLTDAVAALDLKLSAEDIADLESAYRPRPAVI
ncbi:alcohol dehydrogenase [Devosia sp. Leaf420]|uniref:aldo/keto reductase n=1 Tax=Devosia sp. Leaf420 TaxID=1736374 RepID=UPI0007131019|nr:aldo/keto reductase [Devosia sp. Leaf420]KQT51548.1 alcohol dehydrogenase [Devosia sp. Leaf420]